MLRNEGKQMARLQVPYELHSVRCEHCHAEIAAFTILRGSNKETGEEYVTAFPIGGQAFCMHCGKKMLVEAPNE